MKVGAGSWQGGRKRWAEKSVGQNLDWTERYCVVRVRACMGVKMGSRGSWGSNVNKSGSRKWVKEVHGCVREGAWGCEVRILIG